MRARISAKNLTDEEVLLEFVKRFECDAAVLVYLDSENEYGFARWTTSTGKNWTKDVFNAIKKHVYLAPDNTLSEGGITINY